MFSRHWKSCELNYSKERLLELGLLKERCKAVDVEKEYVLYEKRIRSYSLYVFLVFHSVVTVIHCILLYTTCQYPRIIYFDILLYLFSCILIILVLSINFMEELVGNRDWVVYVTSIFVLMTLVIVDFVLHYFHEHRNFWNITANFDVYSFYVIYFFLPIRNIIGPTLLGLFVSIMYILFYFLERNAVDKKTTDIDLLTYISFNLLGAFFRTMCDITIRSSFLERHQYVTEDIMLNHARKQELIFLHSILPPQIARPFQDDIRNRVVLAEKGRESRYSQIKEPIMAIQTHSDVSILYADMVNYTYLTTTLTVQELVSLLHQLYATFDSAAQHFRTQRIKFLGDCYYCVAGLAASYPDHAKSCVNLGHCMIAHIREVRRTCEVDVDMRIGIHSGSVLAGAIGSAKQQYDIWGEDVVIANKLEATGRPGYLHISERTLSLMPDHSYAILPGTDMAREDHYLKQNNIRTYLIPALEYDDRLISREMPNTFQKFKSSKIENEPKDQIRQEMRTKFEQIPIGAITDRDIFRNRRQRPIIGFCCLNFRDPRLEYNYMHQPDIMLKYSILLAWWVYVGLVYVQTIDFNRMRAIHISVNFIFFDIQSLMLFIVWYKTICNWRYPIEHHEYSYFSCCVFFVYEEMQRHLILRVCIYLSIIIMNCIIMGLILNDCDQAEYMMDYIESRLYLYEKEHVSCFYPWKLTEMICLIMGVTLIFTGIPLMMKIVISLMETFTYLIIMFYQHTYLLHNCITTNPFFASEYAHALFTVTTFVVLYYMERQVEFNNKVNYNWKVKLLKKQEAALITNKSIHILLHNILPSHVANVYLALQEKQELYYESFDMVAVMFASLKNFQIDMSRLRFLNEIISEFDTVLSQYKNEFLVDKIKVVGSTYMAACGLDVRLSDRHTEGKDTSSSLKREVTRAQQYMADNNKGEFTKNEEVLFILTTFALDLMRTHWICKNAYKDNPVESYVVAGDMSIGISSGEVMAGVIGASTVHYDIWGNAVNVASRMDSTGIAGHIQVTEESARILERCGVECDYRGMTYVKGLGMLPTYFVGINDNLDFRSFSK